MTLLRNLLNAPARDADETIKTWAVLTGAGTLATLGVLPYSLAVGGKALEKARAQAAAAGKPMPPLPVLLLAGTVQSGLLIGVCAALGLRAARRQGLGAPQLAAVLRGAPISLDPVTAGKAAAAGAAATGVMFLLEDTVFRAVHAALQETGQQTPPAWMGLLATPYGAIAEEILLRLGLQTLLAAGIRRLRRETAVPPGAATMWPAIAVASLAFGAGHLPTARRIMPLTPGFIARTLALNGVGGVVFGYLYWQQGLESAMIAHGTADVLLHVVRPLTEPARPKPR